MSQYDKGKPFASIRALKAFLTRRKKIHPVRKKFRCEGGPFDGHEIFMSPYLSSTVDFVLHGERGHYKLEGRARWFPLEEKKV
jgi:hypothetical protein